MDKIDHSINNNNRIKNDFKKNNNILNFVYSKFSHERNNNSAINNNYRKELIMAKIIISELQDKIIEINKEKGNLENHLNEELKTIELLHKEYISLTDKFDKVNQNIIFDSNNNQKQYIELENKIKELKLKNSQLNEELLTKQEINKLQEETLNKKISLLSKKLEKREEELNYYKKKSQDIQTLEINKNQINNENLSLREDNIKISNKFNNEKKKLYKEIEEYKTKIKKLENEIFILSSKLKEKSEILEKEQKLNSQYSKIDKYFNISVKEQNNDLIIEKYNYLIKEFDEFKIQTLKEKKEFDEKYNDIEKEKAKMEEQYLQKIGELNEKMKSVHLSKNSNMDYEILKQQKKYIIDLFLRVCPNPKLIQQIIEIHKEILQLERKKVSNLINKDEQKFKNILPKINEQINFKKHLNSLEDELINIDFGSSRSNNENSISISI